LRLNPVPRLRQIRRRRPRLPALARQEPLLVALTAATALAYSTFSVLRHLHYGSYAFDLGIFDQAIWHYSRFELAETTIVGLPTILGDHFHPILLVLVPLYWIWADPIMLLVVQGILIAASIVPLFRFCADRVGRAGGYLLALAYTLYWAVHSAINFDFHEIAFAPLLIALALRAVDEERWRRFFVVVVLLLMVKENMAIFVAFLGLYLVALRHYRQGAVTAVAGVAWFVVATKLLIPLFAGGREFRHWNYGEFGTGLFDALGNIVREPGSSVAAFLDSPIKQRTLAYLFAPFLGLTLVSPLLILCVPLVAERMLSANPAHWGMSAHYSLVMAPIVVMGCADGLSRLLRLVPARRLRPRLAVGATAAALAANAAVAWSSSLTLLGSADFYGPYEYDRTVQRALSLIPPTASVAAQSRFVPHLSQRDEIYQLTPSAPRTDYVVADARTYFQLAYPRAGYVDRRRVVLDHHRTHWPIFHEDDLVVLERRPGGQQASAAGPG
jgi:uncharacterized membrane protein